MAEMFLFSIRCLFAHLIINLLLVIDGQKITIKKNTLLVLSKLINGVEFIIKIL
jgi:hypothetical protein